VSIGVKNKKKVDPRETPALYVMDLRQPYSFCGELVHSYISPTGRGFVNDELLSYLSLNIFGKLAYTTSRKVNVGAEVLIELGLVDDEKLSISGFVQKENGRLYCNVMVSGGVFNHIHMTFISSKPEVLRIRGTELYYRQGVISGFDLFQSFDSDALY